MAVVSVRAPKQRATSDPSPVKEPDMVLFKLGFHVRPYMLLRDSGSQKWISCRGLSYAVPSSCYLLAGCHAASDRIHVSYA